MICCCWCLWRDIAAVKEALRYRRCHCCGKYQEPLTEVDSNEAGNKEEAKLIKTNREIRLLNTRILKEKRNWSSQFKRKTWETRLKLLEKVTFYHYSSKNIKPLDQVLGHHLDQNVILLIGNSHIQVPPSKQIAPGIILNSYSTSACWM